MFPLAKVEESEFQQRVPLLLLLLLLLRLLLIQISSFKPYYSEMIHWTRRISWCLEKFRTGPPKLLCWNARISFG